MATPEAKGPRAPEQVTPVQSSKVPINTLAERRSEAKATLVQEELRAKYDSELKWFEKRVKHLEGELEISRAKRKEVEDELRNTKQELEGHLKEAREEIEDLRNRGGERGPRAELEAARRRIEALEAEKDSLTARLGDSAEMSKVSTRTLTELREKAAHAQAAQAAAEKAAQAAAAEIESLKAALAKAGTDAKEGQERAEAAQGDLAKAHEEVAGLQQQLADLQAQLGQAQAAGTEAAADAKRAAEEREAAVAEASGLRTELAAAQTARQRAEGDAASLSGQLTRAQATSSELKAEAAAAALRAENAEAEVARLKGAEGGPAAAAALKDALDKSQRELSVLQAEYSRAVYDVAKAKAEHSEMAGQLAKAKAETVGLQQRLATANLAHAEIAMAAQLALDQVSDIQSCDLLSDQEKGRAVTGSTAAVPAGSPGSDEAARLVSVSQSEGGSAGAVSYKQKAALARQQMEKVRKLASDAVAAATAESASRRESTASAGRLSGSGFTSSVGGSASSAGGAVPLPQPVA